MKLFMEVHYEQQQKAFSDLLIILSLGNTISIYSNLYFYSRRLKYLLAIIFIAILGISGSLSGIVFITGTPLNVGSYTGIIMIVGIIGENSIFIYLAILRIQTKELRILKILLFILFQLRLRPTLNDCIWCNYCVVSLSSWYWYRCANASTASHCNYWWICSSLTITSNCVANYNKIN